MKLARAFAKRFPECDAFRADPQAIRNIFDIASGVDLARLVVSRAAPTLNPEYGANAFSRASVAFAIRSGFIGIKESLKEHAEIGIHFGRGVKYFGMIDGFAEIPAATFASMESPATFMPICLATIASGTVDIPTASAPIVRR